MNLMGALPAIGKAVKPYALSLVSRLVFEKFKDVLKPSLTFYLIVTSINWKDLAWI